MLLRGRGICGGLLRRTRRLWTGISSRFDPLEPVWTIATDLVLVKLISLYSWERSSTGRDD